MLQSLKGAAVAEALGRAQQREHANERWQQTFEAVSSQRRLPDASRGVTMPFGGPFPPAPGAFEAVSAGLNPVQQLGGGALEPRQAHTIVNKRLSQLRKAALRDAGKGKTGSKDVDVSQFSKAAVKAYDTAEEALAALADAVASSALSGQAPAQLRKGLIGSVLAGGWQWSIAQLHDLYNAADAQMQEINTELALADHHETKSHAILRHCARILDQALALLVTLGKASGTPPMTRKLALQQVAREMRKDRASASLGGVAVAELLQRSIARAAGGRGGGGRGGGDDDDNDGADDDDGMSAVSRHGSDYEADDLDADEDDGEYSVDGDHDMSVPSWADRTAGQDSAATRPQVESADSSDTDMASFRTPAATARTRHSAGSPSPALARNSAVVLAAMSRGQLLAAAHEVGYHPRATTATERIREELRKRLRLPRAPATRARRVIPLNFED